MKNTAKLAIGSAVLLGTATLGTVSALAATGTADYDNPVVRTDSGKVRGTVDSQVRQFKGIPYAAPPVGALRWKSPQPVTPWTGVRDATQAGPVCMQPGYDMPSKAGQSED